MNVDVVVDAGNSFIKWGRCWGHSSTGKVDEVVRLFGTAPDRWSTQLDIWEIAGDRCAWAVAGSNPSHRDRIAKWLEEHNQKVLVFASFSQVLVKLNVTYPDKVGLDRLFNALAVIDRKPKDAAAIVIDAGTAITVDYVDEAGVFQGGAILPGMGMMANCLHSDTAALPLLKPEEREPIPLAAPGKSTVEAMILGITACVEGGIERLIKAYARLANGRVLIFVGGGDGSEVRLADNKYELHYWPEMTLEGIRLAAERI